MTEARPEPRRLRIAVLIRKFSFVAGGAERYAAALVKELSARHDIHVFAQDLEAELPGVTLHRVPLFCRRPRWINQWLYSAWTRWQTRQGFDVVHSHDNVSHGDVQTIHVYPLLDLWFREAHTPLARVGRWLKLWTSPRLATYAALEHARLKAQSGRVLVAVSEPVRQVLTALNAAQGAQLAVLTPGLEAIHPPQAGTQQAAQTALGLPAGKRWLLWIGNDVHKKGLPALIEALVALPSDVGLMLAGTSRPKPTWQRQADVLGVRERIVDIGVRDDLHRAYDACDLLVHPTLEDTYGMVVLEAMSHRKPAVVSRAAYCGIAADLRDGENATLLDEPQDVQALRIAILHSLEPATHARLATSALHWAEQHRWPQVAQQQEQIYVAACAARNGNTR